MGCGNEVPLNISMKATKIMKSICQIISRENRNIGFGFFLNYSEALKFLIITTYEINSNELNDYIEIKNSNIENKKLNLQNRCIKYIPFLKNLMIIEIKDSDRLDKYFEFLDYDKDYTKGYNIYNDADIMILKHPFGGNPSSLNGRIDNIINNEFKHDINLYDDSLGCPIILYDDNMNITKIIGINYKENRETNLNGIFIGEIIKEIQNNEIEAEINIEERDINQDIRIINSYEEYMTRYYPDELLDQHHINEEEIKQCQIKINNKSIPFSYFYKFPR